MLVGVGQQTQRIAKLMVSPERNADAIQLLAHACELLNGSVIYDASMGLLSGRKSAD